MPPHPRPLSPVGGEGRILCGPARGQRNKKRLSRAGKAVFAERHRFGGTEGTCGGGRGLCVVKMGARAGCPSCGEWERWLVNASCGRDTRCHSKTEPPHHPSVAWRGRGCRWLDGSCSPSRRPRNFRCSARHGREYHELPCSELPLHSEPDPSEHSARQFRNTADCWPLRKNTAAAPVQASSS